jgi:hypothetical protein
MNIFTGAEASKRLSWTDSNRDLKSCSRRPLQNSLKFEHRSQKPGGLNPNEGAKYSAKSAQNRNYPSIENLLVLINSAWEKQPRQRADANREVNEQPHFP